MRMEKQPDEIAREQSPEPTEPLYTRRTTVGTVKWWSESEGYGAIASPNTAPWDIWCHFGAIERSGGIGTLPTGERFEVTYDEEGRALLPSGEPMITGYIEHHGPVDLVAGERVEVAYHRADQDGFKYVADRVRRLESGAGQAR